MTQLNDFQKKISDNLPGVAIRFDEPMAKHTSFRIGGGAEVMVFPRNGEELSHLQSIHLDQRKKFILLI